MQQQKQQQWHGIGWCYYFNKLFIHFYAAASLLQHTISSITAVAYFDIIHVHHSARA
jgi:hypothetical protein